MTRQTQLEDRAAAAPPPAADSAPPSATAIAEDLRQQIQNSDLHPGQWLREIRLCEEFSAGRSIVRRALAMLAEDGLVVLEPNRGARIVAVTAQEVFDMFELRAGLYGVATRFACRRGSPALIAELLAMIDRLVADSERGESAEKLIEQSETIFSAMAGAASADTQRMIDQVRRKTRWHYSYAALAESMAAGGPFKFWQAARDALAQRDAEAASRAAQNVILYMQGEVARLMLAKGLGS